jgi:hypothetical protein
LRSDAAVIQDEDGENIRRIRDWPGSWWWGRDIRAVVVYNWVVTVIVVATAINAGKRVASQAQLAFNHGRFKDVKVQPFLKTSLSFISLFPVISSAGLLKAPP